MTAGRVVCLAYYFPPLIGIASERATSLSNHLRGLDWDLTIITTRSGHYHRAASSDALDFPVVRTPSIELSRLVRGVYLRGRPEEPSRSATDVRAVQAGPLGSAIRRLIRDFIYIPDAQLGWIPFARRAAVRVVRNRPQGTVLLSTSVPYSAHLAAMAAARRTGAAWVAEFRDPWSTGLAPARSVHPVRQRIDELLERRIVRSADHVIVTSETTRRQFLDAHRGLPAERISVITNGFESIPAGEPPASGEPMTILYAGTVAAGEDMTPVLDVLDGVHARSPGRFQLRVLGPRQPWESAGSSRARPWLALDGLVTPARARQAMASSSALLLVQRNPAYRAVIPGKVFEYIGARRPIIAICPGTSEMGAIAARHADARPVDPLQIEQLAPAVERLIEEHTAGTLQRPRVAEAVVAPLRRVEQARQLDAILKAVAR